jgi:hypothetical protein
MKKGIFCILLSILLLLTGCSKPAANTQPETTLAPTTQAPQVTTLPETTAIPTTAPATEAATEETVPEVELHSGIRSDGTFNEGTVFIGDSLTYGLVEYYLKENDLIGDARYMARVGLPLSGFFNADSLLEPNRGALYSREFYGKTFSMAIAQAGESVTAVYLMLGTNYDETANEYGYIETVAHILESCPNATIYLQLIPYSEQPSVHLEQVNFGILVAVDYFQAQGIQRVLCIDTLSAIGISQRDDGIHLKNEGNQLWYEAILDYAAENGIPE